MSLFSWFSPGRKSKNEAKASILPSSSFSRLDSTKPVNGAHLNQPRPHGHQGRASERKNERTAHREQLYAVVREAMVRAGVLTSSYKFKVLSLDPHGKQYMVMVDLMHGTVSDSSRMAEIEAMVAQSARAKHDILVTAVYWRASDHVSVGDPRVPSVSQPAPLLAEPAARRPHSRPAPVDPLHADEVAAFQQALDAGLRGERALAAANAGRAPHSYTLLTGFEDTEMAADESPAQQLSATQYGVLR